MKLSRKMMAIALCTSIIGADAAQALPAAGLSQRPVTASSQDGSTGLENVYYRRGYGYGYRRGYGRGAIGLGIAGAIIGGAIIANEGYRYRRYRSSNYSARQQCADTYRSFDWDSGTYMGYDGVRHVCPYL